MDKLPLLYGVLFGIYIYRRRKVWLEDFGRTKVAFAVLMVLVLVIAGIFINIQDYRESQPVVPATIWAQN